MKFLTRLVTGFFYVFVLLEFVVLRRVHILYFDLLVALFTLIGYLEVSKAVGDKTDRIQKWISGVTSVGIIVVYAVSDIIFKYYQEGNSLVVNYSPHCAFVVFMTGVAMQFSLLVFHHKRTSLESVAYSLFTLMYPSVFLLVLSGVNHMPDYSEIGLVFTFAICPIADSVAYLFGMAFGKKLPAKMAPNVSPNKTLIGGFGGILGGALGAIAVFYVYYGLIFPGEMQLSLLNVLFFTALGVLTSFFSQLGDLVESAIKRKLGIKDMGKILPGHGGILDRIDSTLYAGLIVCLVIIIRIMTTG